MENKINHILTLQDGTKFLVINQVIFREKNYYFVAKVTEDESDITGEYRIVEETKDGDRVYLSTVQDAETVRMLAEYLEPQE
ncbi:MAG: hypothetical protein HFG40_02210 [Bacilli bacterium]|nr:hypothetical protein [Bacilli bacterium]